MSICYPDNGTKTAKSYQKAQDLHGPSPTQMPKGLVGLGLAIILRVPSPLESRRVWVVLGVYQAVERDDTRPTTSCCIVERLVEGILV